MVRFKPKNTILVKDSDSGRYGKVIAAFSSWDEFMESDLEIVGLYADCGKGQKLAKLKSLEDAESAHAQGCTIICFV